MSKFKIDDLIQYVPLQNPNHDRGFKWLNVSKPLKVHRHAGTGRLKLKNAETNEVYKGSYSERIFKKYNKQPKQKQKHIVMTSSIKEVIRMYKYLDANFNIEPHGHSAYLHTVYFEIDNVCVSDPKSTEIKITVHQNMRELRYDELRYKYPNGNIFSSVQAYIDYLSTGTKVQLESEPETTPKKQTKQKRWDTTTPSSSKDYYNEHIKNKWFMLKLQGQYYQVVGRGKHEYILKDTQDHLHTAPQKSFGEVAKKVGTTLEARYIFLTQAISDNEDAQTEPIKQALARLFEAIQNMTEKS